jgi:hypothetical protein
VNFKHAVITVLACGTFVGSIAIPGYSKTTTDNIFYDNPTAADEDLRGFEKNNPNCPLWTNWQKLCSRINGRTNCKIDTRFPTRPSKPFCLTSIGEYGDPQLEARSLMRFCEDPDYVTTTGSKRRLSVCARYRVNRPFNGRDLDLLRSPACEEWSEVLTGKSVCKESDGSCRGNLRSRQGFYCSKFSKHSCDDYSLYRSTILDRGKLFNTKNLMDKSPVHGSYCGD